MSPPKTVYAGMIVIAMLLAVYFQFRERGAEITTEQQVRDTNRERIDQIRQTLNDVRDLNAENARALDELRTRVQEERERGCERYIYDAPAWGQCMGIETIEWCDLPAGDRAQLIRMGTSGRQCPEAP